MRVKYAGEPDAVEAFQRRFQVWLMQFSVAKLAGAANGKTHVIVDKIVSLTMNPALDIGTRINSVAPEIKLRCAAPEFHPGGGGINVSRAIRFLDGESTAVYAAGGHTGAMLTQLLEAEGIKCRAVPIAGITRESFVVYEESSTLQYRFTMPGPELSAEEWIACLEAVFNLEPEIIVASGSLPAGVPAEFYGRDHALRCRIRNPRGRRYGGRAPASRLWQRRLSDETESARTGTLRRRKTV